MKKYIIILLVSGLIGSLLISCEEYLDKAPEAGLSEEDVFTKYDNLFKYFEWVYREDRNANGGVFYNSYISGVRAGSLDFSTITNIADGGRVMWGLYHQGPGPLGDNNVHYGPRLTAMFKCIRICNMLLENIDRLTDGKQQEIDDLIAQAYFVRGYAHMEVFRLWGPMPYVKNVIGPDDLWDIPRLSPQGTMHGVAADMDTAMIFFEKAGKMRRDPGPGEVGHLNAFDQKKPNGVTASAIKARALLWAASPLYNGTQSDWQDAAVATWKAIELAKQYKYDMVSYENYYDNYYGTRYSNEMLWGHYAGTANWSTGTLMNKHLLVGVITGHKTNNSGVCPSQNHVDMYETIWGDPLNTEEDRAAAEALGHYNEQDPFVNRDPRFYLNIVYNQAPLPGFGKADIYYENVDGQTVYSEWLDPSYAGRTYTGYTIRKTWGLNSLKNPVVVPYTCSMIRLGELYLNYAEAANEAYGPNSAAPGATMTAVDAINHIRAKYPGLAPVQSRFTASKDDFRERIRNERNVELSFEHHYYYDIRRWKTAPIAMGNPIIGMVPEKVPVSDQYPTGFKYNRKPLEDPARQCVWFDAKYYMPFFSTEYYKMKNFDPYEPW
ncbi:MAG: RagB/SusD family nutrient uptake outer membrane protein [Prolixibacteraceae bacterium]|nr:RagB/SusD family nutrient uptake outer membrane protein [Prolixibacteraceae bacterium]